MKDDADDFFRDMFKDTPERRAPRAAIRDSVMPSSHIPKVGSHFRVRFATIADRSYLECIWKCLAHQDGAIVGKCVHGYAYGDGIKTFVFGDMLFYDASDLWAAIEAEKPKAAVLEIVPAAQATP